MQTHPQVFDEKNYYPALLEAINAARGRIIFHSPFASTRRIELLRKSIEDRIRNNVFVCSFLQQVDRNRSTPEDIKRFEDAVELLLRIGVHVTQRPLIHTKAVVVDNSIFDEGSLNVLSHYNTSERMNRWTNVIKVREAVTSLKLNQCAQCFERQPWTFNDGAQLPEKFLAYFGAQIADSRIRAGLSQDELVKMRGMSQKALSNIELGKSNPRVGTVARILSVTGTELIPVPPHLLPAVQQVLKGDGSRRRVRVRVDVP
jgi:DNA-binding XRE family transcriptional regulator